jgi:hypothetical protein
LLNASVNHEGDGSFDSCLNAPPGNRSSTTMSRIAIRAASVEADTCLS